MRAQQQLALNLNDPFDHHQRLHTSPHGVVLIWEKLKTAKRWTKISTDDPVFQSIERFRGGLDTYITVNEFTGWRMIKLLASLRACFVDIDGCTDLEAALDMLREKQMPEPSFVVFSGRGLHLYWTLQATPAKALPVWQAIQDALIRSLSTIGSDRKARDCARVLRLVGSVHSGVNEEVRGLVLTGAEWSLHELADEVLGVRSPKPKTKAEVHSLPAAAARAGKKIRTRSGSIYDWWHLVYTDLCAIAKHQFPDGVTEGQRNNFLYVMSVSLSWFAHVDILTDEIKHTARDLIPTYTAKEIESAVASVVTRAHESAEGKKRAYKGKNYDPRYAFKAETLREYLGDLIPQELHDQLRALAPADLILKRKAERDSGRWNDHNTGAGYRTGNAEGHATARIMAAQGVPKATIARKLGVSRTTIDRWIAE